MQKIFALQDTANARLCSVGAVLGLGAAGCNVACKKLHDKVPIHPVSLPCRPAPRTSPGLTPHIGNTATLHTQVHPAPGAVQGLNSRYSGSCLHHFKSGRSDMFIFWRVTIVTPLSSVHNYEAASVDSLLPPWLRHKKCYK